MSDRKIGWDEVANNVKNNWVVIENVIYDPTKYLNDHPGGPAVIMNRAGKDATKDFLETGHTQGARDKLKLFKVGVIDDKSIPLDWQRGGGTPANAQQFALFAVAFVIVYVIWLLIK